MRLSGRCFSSLTVAELPPCRAESGAFMNEVEWRRLFEHPYAGSSDAAAAHGHLKPTRVSVPPYSTFAVPFWWMLRKDQKAIQESLADPLPPDEEPPFPTGWVFGRARQEALVDLFFKKRLVESESLALFYCKAGHPLGEQVPRLVVGIGAVTKIDQVRRYESSKSGARCLSMKLQRHPRRRAAGRNHVSGPALPEAPHSSPTSATAAPNRFGPAPPVRSTPDPRLRQSELPRPSSD